MAGARPAASGNGTPARRGHGHPRPGADPGRPRAGREDAAGGRNRHRVGRTGGAGPARRRPAGLYASEGAQGTEGRPAVPADVPAPRAIPNATELARALKPLRRTVPSVYTRRLDEAATVRAAADTGLITAVLRPEVEPWLDLTLVVDTGSSMVIWNRLTVELRQLLHRLGAFRRIKVVGLDSDETRMALRTRPFAAGARVAPEVEGRGLTLVLTDGIGPAWHTGAAQRLLARRARAGPLALLHTLPARLWDATGIRCTRLDVRAPGPAAANRLLSVRHPFLPPGLDIGDPKGDVPVPVLEFPTVSPRPWADLVASATEAESLAVTMLGVDARPARYPSRQPATPRERIREFHENASYEAFRLAGHFAAVAPLTLPVMRLVQHATVVGATPAHLAEVFASGLLVVHRLGEQGPEGTEYAFESQVGELLLDTLSVVDGLRTVEGVTRYLARHVDVTPSVSVLLAEGGTTHVVGPDARPFAMADAPLMRRLRSAAAPPPEVEAPEAGAASEVDPDATLRTDPTMIGRALVKELRRLRETRGFTQREVSVAMDWSLSKLIRIETGMVVVTISDLRALLRQYGVRDSARVDEYVAMARAAKRRAWWYPYRNLMTAELRVLLAYESVATLVRCFEPHLVPEPLQTEEYAHAVLNTTLRTPGAARVREAVELRLARQARMLGPDGPTMRLIVDESVLRRMVGGPAVMRRQLRRIHEYAQRPDIDVRVIPFSAGLYERPRQAYRLLSVPGARGGIALAIEGHPDPDGLILREGAEERADEPQSVTPESYLETFRMLEGLAENLEPHIRGHGRRWDVAVRTE
ncbi:Scr1 family TA system antitoxin-like transcriptional regulator (plasmid) [Embleya sp. NBC_00896]|nr:Scr1 family TA system antitoxin-like transcriptional regulator [Embleya sp. NBC_00896]